MTIKNRMKDNGKKKNEKPNAILHPSSNSFKHLRSATGKLPLTPGIYLMRDARGEILYIGKAKSLRKRVRSYFKVPAPIPKIAILMSKVRVIDHIDTPTEVDALLLEAHLIRKHQPRYNQDLKDDKSFPLLKITCEKFPKICVTRQKTDKRAIYYGPYTDAKLLHQAVNLINDLFPIRKCQSLPKTACLYHHIGQCLAPCIKPGVKPEYDRLINEVKHFLGGGKKSFAQYLGERMEKASRELRFEDAQFFKEQIDALSKLRKKRFLPKNPGQGISLSATIELKQLLKLERIPERIVCFDVSNMQGDQAVASKVSFYRELPDKFGYRRYRIRSVSGINDYAMISEALTRMLRGIKEGRENFMPDLILIDGGRGHLNTAARVLAREGMTMIELISIAKQFEWVHSPKFRAPLVIESDSPALYLLKKIRDEAHRFAIGYHRKLKAAILQCSVLDDIPGIGEERKRILLRHFNSTEEIRLADIEKLQAVPGIGPDVATRIFSFFHASGSKSEPSL
ncbi:MAG: excinuclease ABC subunit UvrC [Candidatus Omnitrophota bacterium]|jgi:excinuclease ABC subunit C